MSAISRINWRVRITMGLVLALVCSFSSFIYMVGDYFSLSFVNTDKVYPVFMDATAPNGQVFNEAAFTSGYCGRNSFICT